MSVSTRVPAAERAAFDRTLGAWQGHISVCRHCRQGLICSIAHELSVAHDRAAYRLGMAEHATGIQHQRMR